MQKELGMPVNGQGIGPYDQVSLSGGVSGWSHNEDSSPVGTSPLPSQADNTNEIMFLVDNKVDPECCPAAFTTDTGCVCLTEENRQLMASRGGNRA